MKKENLIYSTLILTIASIITRIIGMVFRVYLSNQIGAVGMGLYQMIISVYSFASTFACSGIVVAVSSLVSAHLARHEGKCAKYILHFCVTLSVVLGITAGAVLYFCSDIISSVLLKDMNAAFSLKILAPSMVFMSLSSCYRGYFLAISKVSKPAIAMIVEQLVRMFVITSFMGIWLSKGIKYSCAAAVIGMTIGDLLDPVYIVYAPKTFLLKLCIGLITGLVAHKIGHITKETDNRKVWKWVILAAAAGLLFNVIFDPLIGYLYKLLILGKPAAELTLAWNVTATSINAVTSTIVSSVVYMALRPALKKAGLFMEL